jgi:alkylation response protein AidB-like acyl-CoA dehydrogenase
MEAHMSPDEIKLRVQEIAQDIAKGLAEKTDREAIWPEQAVRAIQAAGLGGLTVPVRYGGLGGGLLSMAEVSEILARECSSTATCFGMHCVAAAVISAKATPEQVERFLTPICEGRHLTTLALSEPGTGAHFYIPQATIKANGEHYEINGTKSFVTNSVFADSCVISVVAAEHNAPIGEFSLIIMPSKTEGISWKGPWRGLGMRGNASADATISSAYIPKANLLGQKGDQIWYVFEVVTPFFLMAMAGTYLGIADAAITEAIAHIKERSYSHSGQSLANVSIIQHKLGTLWSRVEGVRQLLYHSARLGDAGDARALPAIFSAKAEAGDCVTKVTNEVMSLMGGRGYAENGKIARLLRDGRAAHVMAPTTDILRTWTGRALLGEPLLSE